MSIFELVGQRIEAVLGCFREKCGGAEELEGCLESEQWLGMIVKVPLQLN